MNVVDGRRHSWDIERNITDYQVIWWFTADGTNDLLNPLDETMHVAYVVLSLLSDGYSAKFELRGWKGRLVTDVSSKFGNNSWTRGNQQPSQHAPIITGGLKA